jgi:hypothetical protein
VNGATRHTEYFTELIPCETGMFFNPDDLVTISARRDSVSWLGNIDGALRDVHRRG